MKPYMNKSELMREGLPRTLLEAARHPDLGIATKVITAGGGRNGSVLYNTKKLMEWVNDMSRKDAQIRHCE